MNSISEINLVGKRKLGYLTGDTPRPIVRKFTNDCMTCEIDGLLNWEAILTPPNCKRCIG